MEAHNLDKETINFNEHLFKAINQAQNLAQTGENIKTFDTDLALQLLQRAHSDNPDMLSLLF